MNQRVDALRTVLANSLGNTVQLTTTVAPEAWPVEVDTSELELALVNIAVNSRDAMPEGGLIAITVENVRLSRGEVPGDLIGDFVALTIADEGVGIPENILPKVFDPFFTTKRIGKGTGLGLSQVYGFAHQSGGTVTVRSEIGQGTRSRSTCRARAALRPRFGLRNSRSTTLRAAWCCWLKTIRWSPT